MDIVLPNIAVEPYKIPAKHLSDILFAMRQRYKDNSLNIANVGQKIKLLIDEHLIGIGVNPKIPPTELFSATFIQELNKITQRLSQSPQRWNTLFVSISRLIWKMIRFIFQAIRKIRGNT